jgi:excinuclease ABC subunit C
MKQCCGVCAGVVSPEEYDSLIRCAIEILRGHTGKAIETLKEKMTDLAEKERFEAAARCRDTIKALRQLSQKQHVVASPDTNADVFGFYHHEWNSCISVLYIREGMVIDKADYLLSGDAVIDSNSLSAFLVDHYLMRNDIPKTVCTSFVLEEDDHTATEVFLEGCVGHKVEIRHPERGTFRELCQTVVENAGEKVKQANQEIKNNEELLCHLAQRLGLPVVPERIEAYDISNIGAEHITAGMVVFENGKPKKSDYRSFKIQSVKKGTDDYASMKEALIRRLRHLKEDSTGSFAQYPDLLLIDGGRGHVSVALEALEEEGFHIPVFGMVKDDFHKTRALCTVDEEINIGRDPSIFTLIYKIQEEVHRFTVGRTTRAKRSTLKKSSLEKIEGIGPQKAKKLLGAMGTLSAIKKASVEEIEAIHGISSADARQIFSYYHSKKEEGEKEES